MNHEQPGEKPPSDRNVRGPQVGSVETTGRFWALRWTVLPFVALYAAGYFFPQTWWGTHFIHFLPHAAAAGVASAAVLLIFFFKPTGRAPRTYPPWIPGGKPWSLVIVVLFSIACALAYFDLTTATDIYGDARRNLQYIADIPVAFDPGWIRQIFSVDILNRTAGESLVFNLVLLTRWFFKIDGAAAFGVVNAAFGFVFVLAWCLFVRSRLRGAAVRTIAALGGATPGFAAVFTDHAEVYAAGAVFMLIYLVVNVRCFMRNSLWSPWALTILLFLAIRSFFGNNVLWVPFLSTMAYLELKKYSWFDRRFNRRWILLFVVLPILAAFTVYYFFVVGNQEVSRYVNIESRHRTMFLPLLNAEPPGVPAYTMFSPSHVVDFVNVMVFWSVPALFVVLALWTAYGGKRSFGSPHVLVVEVTLLLYAFAFFVTNPLLSMPRDWDLFSMATPALLVYSVLLFEQVQGEPGLKRRLVGPVLGFLLLGAPAFAVNRDRNLLTHRLETVGLQTYKTYFYGASYILNVAISMSGDDPDEYLRRRVAVVDEVKPYKLQTDDAQFADLTYRLAELYVERKEYTSAKRYLYEAFSQKPRDAGLRYCVAQVHYNLGEYPEALLFADELSKKLTNEPDIQQLAFLAAYGAGEFDRAVAYGRRYLTLRPNDAEIKSMVDSLTTALEQPR